MNTSPPVPNSLQIPDSAECRIRFQVDRIARQWRLSVSDRADVRQTVLLHTIRALRRHDPERGHCKPLANGAVDLAIRAIRRSLKTQAKRRDVSLEVHLVRHATIHARDSGADLDRETRRVDTRSLLATLPPGLRTLPYLLVNMTPTQIARATGRSRTGLYRDIGRLLQHFHELSPYSRDTRDARAER